jgi:thiol:disulfide interchange protein DsbD
MEVLKKTTLLLIIFLTVVGFLSAAEVETSLKLEQNGASGIIKATFVIPQGHHQSYEIDDEFAQFYLESETSGVTFQKTVYPLTEGKSAGDIVEYHDSVTLTKAFTITDSSVKEISVDYGYQICLDSGSCMRPIFETQTLALTPIATAKEAIPVSEDNSGTNVLYFLLLAFLGGVILNIMPCVLPVLSIKAMSLVKQSQHNKSNILKGSLAYTAGIIISFLILAAVVVGIKSTGESLSWGFQFQNPWFVFSLLILIWVFTLSLYEVFQIRVPGMSMATQASSKGGHSGSFFSGIFAVLLATPCTAPLLAPAIGFAFQQSALVIFSSFVMIGLGLAFPFLLLGFIPSAIKIIPKPGNWMITFKELMGFLLFGTAIYLLRTLYFLLDGAAFMNIIWFLLTLSIGCWIYGRFAGPSASTGKQWLWTIIALLVIFGTGHFLINFEDNGVTDGQASVKGLKDGWQVFTEDTFEQYRAENKPIFIDFGAEWCLTCKTNEANVLHTDKIMQVFKDNNVELLFGNNTKKNEVVEKWLAEYKRAGVPLYLYFAPGADEAVVLPELITNSHVTDLFEKE